MNPFSSPDEYERFIYALQDLHPAILRSTLVFIRRGRYFSEVQGELAFANGYRMTVYERLRWLTLPGEIAHYGYEIWHDDDKLYWYDSQPHPDDPTLAETHPHHKHIPPDIKHHRVPAPGLTFSAPNLPLLIAEITSLSVKTE